MKILLMIFVFIKNTYFFFREEYYDLMTFYVPSNEIKWSQIFGIMQDAKGRLGVDDYSIAQASLEQIFLSFTKYQRGGEND